MCRIPGHREPVRRAVRAPERPPVKRQPMARARRARVVRGRERSLRA